MKDLRKEQEEKRARGELMGIGISSFTEVVGAGPVAKISIFWGSRCLIRPKFGFIRPARPWHALERSRQGQGHETTYAQIIAEELGLPANDIEVEEGDTDTAPYGLGNVC